MLDIRRIRENPELVKERLATRGGREHEVVAQILDFDRERRAVETRLQQLQAERKRSSKEIGQQRAKSGNPGQSQELQKLESSVRAKGEEIDELDRQAVTLDARQRALLLELPNLPATETPVGKNATENSVIRSWGEKPALCFPPKSHVDLGQQLALFDFERASKISGSAFVCYTGQGARLERVLINLLLDLHTLEHGYTEINPPVVIRPEALIGTAQLPKFEEQQYRCERDDLYLAPTAEVPVTNLHRGEILPAAELPKKYVAYTPCFRREAGAAGLGTRGLIRMHQFDKVELVKITRPEESAAELELLTADAERVLQLLGLHYRLLELCTGDLGFGAARTYDIEVWAPGQNAYLEVSSCSNFGDFQARRMNLRYKGEDGKNRFCHTLNGSGTALPRLYVALLETYQQLDGTVLLPKALHAPFGADRLG